MTKSRESPALTRQLAAGQEYHRAGKLREAERCYRDVLRRDQGHPIALHLLGVLATQEGRHAAAAGFLARAAAREPANAELLFRLAQAQRLAGAHEEAHAAFLRAADRAERPVEVLVECAISAEEAAQRALAKGDVAAAERWRKRAAEQLWRVGRLHAAVRSGARGLMAYRRALELDPDNAELACDAADLLAQMGRPSEAEPLYRQALQAAPRSTRTLNNLANALIDLGKGDEARQTFERALAIEPDMPEARYGVGSGALLNLCYRPDVDAAALFEAHRHWGDALIARQTETPARFLNERDPERRLRVGYVSPDFHQHSTNHYFGPLLVHHDRQAVEIFLYGEVREPDAVTKRFQESAAHWRSTVGIGDAELRRQVREDRIDILVDLAGHTGSTRLAAFAVRPAPVTATWLGYPGTTGLSTVDYRLTDAQADPPGIAERQHTETLLRLPHCFLCYAPPPGLPPVAPAPVLTRGAVTFGSFNNLAKVTRAVLETWAEILRAVPGSRLLMKGKLLADPAIRRRVIDAFAAGGIEPDRLDLRGLIPGAVDHLSLYREVDIGLDPFPYNGTTTTSEAMWMGVPVVTLIGDHHVARVGLSLVTQVGLGHLAALDRAHYVRIATELARDPDALNTLRLTLRDRFRASPHGDAPRFARDFEAALRGAWRRWCAGEG